MTVTIRSLHPTNPAPVHITSNTVHVVATSSFLYLNSATWALHSKTCDYPQFVGHWSFILTLTSVPKTWALEAHLRAAFANSLVPATAWLANCFTAVRSGTPFEVLVLSNTNIFPDNIKFLRHIFGAKPLDVSCTELLFAFVLHARQVHSCACLNASLQVVTVAVNAEAMAAN